MEDPIHKIIAFLFMPQLTPAYFFAFLIMGNLPALLGEFAIAIAFTVLVPLASLIAYVKIKNIDFYISNKDKRDLLFYVAVTSYFIGFMALFVMRADFIVTALMLSYMINTLAASLINRVDKISVHVWGISGPAVSLLYLCGYTAFAGAILVALLVGASRIRVKAHTLWQVLSAIAVSIPLTIFIIYYLAPLIL